MQCRWLQHSWLQDQLWKWKCKYVASIISPTSHLPVRACAPAQGAPAARQVVVSEYVWLACVWYRAQTIPFSETKTYQALWQQFEISKSLQSFGRRNTCLQHESGDGEEDHPTRRWVVYVYILMFVTFPLLYIARSMPGFSIKTNYSERGGRLVCVIFTLLSDVEGFCPPNTPFATVLVWENTLIVAKRI